MKPEYCVLAAIFLPFLGALIIPMLSRYMGRRVGWVALLFPVLSTVAILCLLFQGQAPEGEVVTWAWVPILGVNFSFLIDGLSLFFGLVVSGMGVLIFWYAIFYLDRSYQHQGRFYCYLTLFMAAMLGTVFADHLLLLFIFWELTGLASYLLIGFLHEEKNSQVGARQALLVTASTGLVMLVGILLVGLVGGEYSLQQLLQGKLPMADHRSLLNWAMLFIMVGAFGKSAQIPFHFWLPNAMAAPTPVSAYLHSATMVKLGIYLTARVFPIFVENEFWSQLLIPIGFGTMALGAVLALLSNNLKAILAFSTVSALGSFIGYYGLGKEGGVSHDYLHIMNHVLYKGCLFMVVGIVIHATGVKDIRKLGGLLKRMPLLGVACLVAAASMAGIPGTLGFVSKEALLAEVLAAPGRYGGLGGFALCAVLLASTAKMAFSLRLFWNIFKGEEPQSLADHYHTPSLKIQIPPMILAVGVLIFGLMPGLLETVFQRLAVVGLNEHPAHLAVWHGFELPLWISAFIIVMGTCVFVAGQKVSWKWAEIPIWIQVDRIFESGLTGLGRFSGRMIRWLRMDRPLDFLPIMALFGVVVLGGYLWGHYNPWTGQEDIWKEIKAPPVFTLRLFIAVLMAFSVFGVVVLKRWTTQLISLSVMGFLVTFYFVLYRAPDLALTQILVDTATVVMILILLGRFPRRAEEGESKGRYSAGRRIFNMGVSAGVGLVATMYILIMTNQPHDDRIGQRFLDTTLELAEGSNAVNTILVDYRGFDTLWEITVLFIAMLACLGLVTRYKRTKKEYEEGPVGVSGYGLHKEEEE